MLFIAVEACGGFYWQWLLSLDANCASKFRQTKQVGEKDKQETTIIRRPGITTETIKTKVSTTHNPKCGARSQNSGVRIQNCCIRFADGFNLLVYYLCCAGVSD